MAVYFENNSGVVKTKTENATTVVLRQMLDDTYVMSIPVTPLKDGHLRAAINRRMTSPKAGFIEWLAPYASYQDRGMRADGSRVVRNYTTAGTHSRFASESVAKVLARLPKYVQMQGMLV